jgi:hypothetical protein
VILADVGARVAIPSRAKTFEFASANHPCEYAGVNAVRSGITSSQVRTLGHEAQHTRASGPSMCCGIVRTMTCGC